MALEREGIAKRIDNKKATKNHDPKSYVGDYCSIFLNAYATGKAGGISSYPGRRQETSKLMGDYASNAVSKFKPSVVGKLTGKSSGCSTLPVILIALADATVSRMICDPARINPLVSSFTVFFAVKIFRCRKNFITLKNSGRKKSIGKILPEKDDPRFVAAKKFRVAADKVLSRTQTTHSVPVDYRNNGFLVSANARYTTRHGTTLTKVVTPLSKRRRASKRRIDKNYRKIIRLTRSISPNIPDRTRPSRVYVTKVLDLPVTPVSITHGCLPNDLRLCADYQPNFPLKIIKKEEDELIQSNDQNSTIKMHEKTYLAVPPKVKISWLNKENNSKIIDQLTSYTDHESKINTTESTQNHKPKINTTKSTNNIADKRRNKVNYQPISYMNHDKLSYQHISDMKINTIKPIDHQPEISTTEPIENRRKYKVNYSKITDSLKYEMNFSDNIEHSKYIPVEHAFGSFHDTYQINQ
ncbi:hypothetical protein ALC60_01112 [Trachymyrmex zeteki]|uniref:Uncharacterized protein n=1 Tax=Mycetomoellerius zeteki TaxID=64791 RepID=A0A151XHG2_9HYME|nr:hypothetical protein ALC60_01112 [Trachymyrmex zeteki]